MTAEIQQSLLDIHNQYRQQIADGEIDNYDAASNMATMEWDPTLASFAELNVRNCTFAHDGCMNTGNLVKFSISCIAINRVFFYLSVEDFYPVGQNIAIQLSDPSQPADTDPNIPPSLAATWFTGEYQNGQYYGWMDLINQYPSEDTSSVDEFNLAKYSH